ncbi:hypothetical protein HDU76_011156 [Blyttiomyces sp. JEL0837]|nr:hypothetical protein HDU76_011156 [Blyttiomyces sp. JEL0837]
MPALRTRTTKTTTVVTVVSHAAAAAAAVKSKRKTATSTSNDVKAVVVLYISKTTIPSTPVGALTIAATSRGLCYANANPSGKPSTDADAFFEEWTHGIKGATFVVENVPYGKVVSELDKCKSDKVKTPLHHLTTAVERLTKYFSAKVGDDISSFDLNQIPVDLDPVAGENTTGSSFQVRVWEALLTIPMGLTVDYSTVAERVGNPKAVRAVGTAIGRNPVGVIVPCHRVIGKDGSLRGYRGGLEMKQILLDLEGGTVKK